MGSVGGSFLACSSGTTSEDGPEDEDSSAASGGTSSEPDPEPKPSCAPLTGSGTEHGAALAQDEVWTAEGSPYLLPSGLTVREGQSLRIEPCAVVRIGDRAGILVQGELHAEGTEEGPIVFERLEETAWGSIETRTGGELRLNHTTVRGGGNANGGRLVQFGMLDIRGEPNLFVDHVQLEDSEALGIYMREGGAFLPGSRELSITGGASFPALLWSNVAGTLPSGRYTGNAVDEIFLPALLSRDAIQEDMTISDHGVPYRVGGETGGSGIRVSSSGGTAALLTIEPGVTLRFSQGTRLELDGSGSSALGALHAEGTSDHPIILTSAEESPAPGDWVGLTIGGRSDDRNSLSHVKISYAGGPSGISSYGCPSAKSQTFSNEASVIIYGAEPSRAFIKNSVIENSAGDGIVRGWEGEPLDFLESNSFSNITRCFATYPKPTNEVCPNPAPCPE